LQTVCNAKARPKSAAILDGPSGNEFKFDFPDVGAARSSAHQSMTKQPRNRPGKQKALISAATSLFARRGLRRTTTREIAARILQPRLGDLLRKYMPARIGLIAQRIRSYKQYRCSDDEDIEVLAHALTSLSFDFGSIRPVILRQNRQETKHLAKRAANLLSRSVLNIAVET